jgi:hypothetical protein
MNTPKTLESGQPPLADAIGSAESREQTLERLVKSLHDELTHCLRRGVKWECGPAWAAVSEARELLALEAPQHHFKEDGSEGATVEVQPYRGAVLVSKAPAECVALTFRRSDVRASWSAQLVGIFGKGSDAFLAGKKAEENPYVWARCGFNRQRHDYWRQGWESERDIAMDQRLFDRAQRIGRGRVGTCGHEAKEVAA